MIIRLPIGLSQHLAFPRLPPGNVRFSLLCAAPFGPKESTGRQSDPDGEEDIDCTQLTSAEIDSSQVSQSSGQRVSDEEGQEQSTFGGP